MLLALVVDSFNTLPIGKGLLTAAAWTHFVKWSSMIFLGAVLLALPVGVGLVWICYVLLVLNWDFFLPRYLYPTIPGLMLLAAVSIGRLRGGARALTASAAVITALLAVWWVYLSTVEPFTG